MGLINIPNTARRRSDIPLFIYWVSMVATAETGSCLPLHNRYPKPPTRRRNLAPPLERPKDNCRTETRIGPNDDPCQATASNLSVKRRRLAPTTPDPTHPAKAEPEPAHAMFTDIEHYFTRGCGRCDRFGTPGCSTRRWADGLQALRDVCCGTGLQETLKWAHPCYMHAGRNIAIIGAFRKDFRLSFFNAALMKDPENVLERQGPNTPHPGTIRMASNARIAELEPVIRRYLREAMTYAEEGMTPPRDDSEPGLPEELTEAFDADPELADAYRRLTRGRRKSYAIALNAAKNPETRIRRIANLRNKIIAGKGATER